MRAYNDDYHDYGQPDCGDDDAWEDAVQFQLTRLVEAELDRLFAEAGRYPSNLDEDAFRAELEAELRDEAEDAAHEWLLANMPCCNDWHCPCGNDASPPSISRGVWVY